MMKKSKWKVLLCHGFRSGGYNSVIWESLYRLYRTFMDERIPIIPFRERLLLIAWYVDEKMKRVEITMI